MAAEVGDDGSYFYPCDVMTSSNKTCLQTSQHQFEESKTKVGRSFELLQICKKILKFEPATGLHSGPGRILARLGW